MKNINLIFLLIIGICIISLSCEENSESLADHSSEELALIEFAKDLTDIKTNLNKTNAIAKGEPLWAATFDIRMEGEQFIIENIVYYNEFEYGFAQAFSDESAAKSQSSGSIKVSCDATDTITECPETDGLGGSIKQAKSIGEAVKACLDGGGCAEVCSMQAFMTL